MPPANKTKRGSNSLLWDLLTFDRLVTGPVIHFIYWAGLGVVALFGFSVVGAAVGLALKEPGVGSLLLAFPVLVAGLLVAGALVLLWRAFCEFYVAIFRISEDLRALRQTSDADNAVLLARRQAAPQPGQAPQPPLR
jgi:Na+/H+ antiporter NhaC